MGLNTIVKMRLPNGMEVALVDWTDKPLWSTADFVAGFTQQETILFSYIPGDQVPAVGPAAVTRRTATDRDTNLSTPGAMASTEEMLVYAIKVEFFELVNLVTNDLTSAVPVGSGQPIPQIQRIAYLNWRLLLNLRISQKDYARGPLGYFPTGFGPYGTAQGFGAALAAANVPVTLGNQGQPQQNAVRSFVIPHHIGGQEKYSVRIINPGGAAVDFNLAAAVTTVLATGLVMQMRVILDGLYKRPVS